MAATTPTMDWDNYEPVGEEGTNDAGVEFTPARAGILYISYSMIGASTYAGGPIDRTLDLYVSPSTSATEIHIGQCSGNAAISQWCGFQEQIILGALDTARIACTNMVYEFPGNLFGVPYGQDSWHAFFVPFSNDIITGVDWLNPLPGPTVASATPTHIESPVMVTYTMMLDSALSGANTVGPSWSAPGFELNVPAVLMQAWGPSGDKLLMPCIGAPGLGGFRITQSYVLTDPMDLYVSVNEMNTTTALEQCVFYPLLGQTFSLDDGEITSAETEFLQETLAVTGSGLCGFSGGGGGSSAGWTWEVNLPSAGLTTLLYGASYPQGGGDMGLWWFSQAGDKFQFGRQPQDTSDPGTWGASLFSTGIFSDGRYIPGAVLNSSKAKKSRNWASDANYTDGGYTVLDSALQPSTVINSIVDTTLAENAGQEVNSADIVKPMKIEEY